MRHSYVKIPSLQYTTLICHSYDRNKHETAIVSQFCIVIQDLRNRLHKAKNGKKNK